MRSYFRLIVFTLSLAFLAATASAQTGSWNGNKINGLPASVTSYGFGGRPGFLGMPASVTSLNFGNAPATSNWRHPHVGFDGIHHRGNRGLVNPVYGGTYYVPYAYPIYLDSGYDTPMQAEEPLPAERPDTTDQLRRELDSLKSTIRDYRDELRTTRVVEQPAPKPETEQPAANQPETILVFRDGHQVEIHNYAIVGSTLYDLSEGRTKRVALAELDLPATVRQNDERGVEFRVPAGISSN